MKKRILTVFLIPLSILIGSWGSIGHQTVARIAEYHLTAEARTAVKDLLGNETLPGISSWADQVRSEPEYKMTGDYHFVNLPTGLNEKQFDAQLKSLKKENLYKALMRYENALSDPLLSKEKRAEALKFVVHLVGDAHQPMHVSRAEDKGGNTIQVQFDGRGTNLHALWDSRLIDYKHSGSAELAKTCNRANDAQVKAWQAAPVSKWLYESYQLSNSLYTEIEKNNKLTEDYYTRHFPEIQNRLEQGGVRLAAVLNEIFKNYRPSAVSGTTATENIRNQQPVTLKNTSDILNYLGRQVTVSDIVYDYKVINNRLILLNLGGKYPNQILTIAVKGPSTLNPAELQNKRISVTGTPRLFKGKPEIETTGSDNIRLQDSK